MIDELLASAKSSKVEVVKDVYTVINDKGSWVLHHGELYTCSKDYRYRHPLFLDRITNKYLRMICSVLNYLWFVTYLYELQNTL